MKGICNRSLNGSASCSFNATNSCNVLKAPIRCQLSRQLWSPAFNPSRVLPSPRLQRLCAIQAEADPEVHASLDFPSWLAQSGLPQDKQACQPEVVDGQRALVTSKALSKGDILFTVPEALWITPETVSKSSIGPFCTELEPWLQLALFLMLEKAQPSQPWGPYVQSLPDASLLQSPVFWTVEELQLLEGSSAGGATEGYRGYFQARFGQLEAELFAPNRDAFPAEAFGFESFLWAAATVRARVHAPLEQDKVALVPFADLVQHQRGGGASGWEVQSAGLLARGQTVVLKAQKNYEAGEVVTMDYGPDQLDAKLLLDYGVLDLDTPQGGFELQLAIPEGDRFFDDKADILEQAGFSESTQFKLLPGVPPSEEMLAFLRLMNLSGIDAFLLEALFRNEVWRHMLSPVSEVNETMVYQSMINGCREALAAYCSSIDEDLALVQSLSPKSRQMLAVKVRLGEKEALDSTLRWFEERFARISTLEFYQERRLKGLGLLDESGRTTYDSFFKDGIA